MKKIFENAKIWCLSALTVTMLSFIFLMAFDARLGELSGLFIFPVAFYAACFAFAGTLIQGVFINMNYYQMGAAASILSVGTLTFFTMLMFHETQRTWEFDLWLMATLLSIPCYTVTAISYFSTRDN